MSRALTLHGTRQRRSDGVSWRCLLLKRAPSISGRFCSAMDDSHCLHLQHESDRGAATFLEEKEREAAVQDDTE